MQRDGTASRKKTDNRKTGSSRNHFVLCDISNRCVLAPQAERSVRRSEGRALYAGDRLAAHCTGSRYFGIGDELSCVPSQGAGDYISGCRSGRLCLCADGRRENLSDRWWKQ